jgi:hypothetical protein
MRVTTVLSAAAALSAVVLLQGQSSGQPDFRPLEFLVGHCWVGTFPDGKQTDEHCFEWVFDHKFIRDRHVVRNGKAPYEGETLYGWDPKEKRLAFWYWNSEGEILRGRVDYSPEGIVFPTQYEGKTGPVELRATWTPQGSEGYRVRQEQRAGTTWKLLWTMDLKRR